MLHVTSQIDKVCYTEFVLEKGGHLMAENKQDNLELECEHCGTTSELTPVLTYVYQGEEKHVCTHCLPMLIHG